MNSRGHYKLVATNGFYKAAHEHGEAIAEAQRGDHVMDTITQQDIGDVLANMAMLATFTSYSWTGEASDAGAVEDVRLAKGAKGDVGVFRKKLLANHDGLLKDVERVISAAYRDHVRLTSSWADGKGGPRMLPNAGFTEYLQTMHEHKTKLAVAVQALAAGWDDAVAKAKVDLGQLAQGINFPTSVEIASHRFGVDFNIEPMPGGKGFPGLPPQFAMALEQRLVAKTKERMAAAIAELWNEIRTILSRYHNQTRPDGKIYETTVTEILGMPQRIRTFNVVGDAKLEAVAALVQERLGAYDLKSLKQEQTRVWCHTQSGTIIAALPAA